MKKLCEFIWLLLVQWIGKLKGKEAHSTKCSTKKWGNITTLKSIKNQSVVINVVGSRLLDVDFTKQNKIKKEMKMKKPNLNHAKVIKTSSSELPKSMLDFMSPEAIARIKGGYGFREIGTDNMGVGEWFVIEKYLPGDYHRFATDGSRSELSVFRMAGGCNHLRAFDNPGAEKAEDYDLLPDEAILWLPDNFGEAVEIIEQDYIGRKLRVVARSADGMDQYGHRYYLFAVE